MALICIFFNYPFFDMSRTDISVTVETQIPKVSGSSGTFVAVRVDQGGCNAWEAKGIFLFILPDQQKFVLANDLCKWSCIFVSNVLIFCLIKMPFLFQNNLYFNLSLSVVVFFLIHLSVHVL